MKMKNEQRTGSHKFGANHWDEWTEAEVDCGDRCSEHRYQAGIRDQVNRDHNKITATYQWQIRYVIKSQALEVGIHIDILQ